MFIIISVQWKLENALLTESYGFFLAIEDLERKKNEAF